MITARFTFVPEYRRLHRAAARAKRRSGMRAGGLVRTIARRSIRRRKGSAPRGQPPHAHARGNRGMKLIYFAWDPQTESVPIGPIPFGQRHAREIQEGGLVDVIRRRRRGTVERRRLRLAPHPVMGPALEKAIPRIPRYWRNAIGR